MTLPVVDLNPEYFRIVEQAAQALSSVILSVEPQEGVDITLIVLQAPGEDGRFWLQGLPRAVVLAQRVAGPELAASLDQVAAAGERPVLILLYEDMQQLPVATVAAGLSPAGFSTPKGAA